MFVLIPRTVQKLQQCKYAEGNLPPLPLPVYVIQIPLYAQCDNIM